MSEPRKPGLLVIVKKFPKLSETFILGELHSLADAGYRITVASLSRPDEEVTQPSAKRFEDSVIYLESEDNSIWLFLRALVILVAAHPLRLIQACWAVRRTKAKTLRETIAMCYRLRKSAITHVHAHYFFAQTSNLGVGIARYLGVGYSISGHAKDIYLTPERDLARHIDSSSFVVTCTQHNFDYLRRLTFHPDRVHRVYHGIDRTFFTRQESAAPRVPHILAVGRYRKKKGYDVLIRSCYILKRRGIAFSCSIIGYGEEEQNLSALIAKLQLQAQVSLVTPVNHDSLKKHYQNASVLALPCRIMQNGDRDGIPNVMLEAMSMGLPVITTNVSGIPEVIRNKVNGLMIDPEDAQAMADAIEFALTETSHIQEMALEARRTVSRDFCWNTNINRLVGLIRETAAEKSGVVA